ncbi:MAG TPA: deoxyribose-phosphate aldolase, partial [Clostridiales bacterium]|nr:deoxyribose-phosphate aldolase [Clostridiales bacterium]
RLSVCTVIGFPNGYNTTAAKLAETRDALENGADEIDMVINIGALKDGEYNYILEEIRLLKSECKEKILKVIIEACLLTDSEKVKMCELVTLAGADFIKTSTGFSTGGATLDDIRLFAAHIGPDVKMKAAGSIRSLEDAQAFLDLGCERLGTSTIVKILKNQDIKGY